jgi:hypothetical protein
VQRLVHIAHKVNDVLQRQELLVVRGARSKDLNLPVDGAHHALSIRAVALRNIRAVASGKVDVMPRRCCRIPMLICPCRNGR